MYRPTRPDCETCIEKYKQRKDPAKRTPPCYTSCGKVSLIRENYQTFNIIGKWGSVFKSSFGGISLNEIKTALELEGIEPDQISLEAEKILAFIQATVEVSKG